MFVDILSSGPTHGITAVIPARILAGITASGVCCIELKRIILSVIPTGMPAVMPV